MRLFWVLGRVERCLGDPCGPPHSSTSPMLRVLPIFLGLGTKRPTLAPRGRRPPGFSFYFSTPERRGESGSPQFRIRKTKASLLIRTKGPVKVTQMVEDGSWKAHSQFSPLPRVVLLAPGPTLSQPSMHREGLSGSF